MAKAGLCKGRHDIPGVTHYIFPQEVNPLDVDGLQVHANAWLEKNYPKDEHLELYVTGLTVALIAALNAAHNFLLEVTLYHYDRETGKYYPQAAL